MGSACSGLRLIVGAICCVSCHAASGVRPARIPAVEDAETELQRLGERSDGTAPVCSQSRETVTGFEKNCGKNDRDACVRAALGYWRGCGVPTDHQLAKRYFATACALGSLTSCDMQGQLLLAETPPKIDEAAELLKKACEQGYGRACGNFGIVLATRLEPPTDERLKRGIALVDQQCTQNYPSFCPLLAMIVKQRRVVTLYAHTRQVLQRACTAKHLDSCYALAISLEDGDLGVKDYVAAADVAARSCEQRHLPSCNAVGYMLVKGHGFPQDLFQGTALFYYACGAQYAPACDSMGEAVENGWGVEIDGAKATEFYAYGCALGDTVACKKARSVGTPNEK